MGPAEMYTQSWSELSGTPFPVPFHVCSSRRIYTAAVTIERDYCAEFRPEKASEDSCSINYLNQPKNNSELPTRTWKACVPGNRFCRTWDRFEGSGSSPISGWTSSSQSWTAHGPGAGGLMVHCLCASLLIMEREGCKIYLKKSGLRHPVTAAAC